MEKEISSNKLQNSLLEDKVNRISTELTEKTANGISLSETCDELKKKLCENEKLRRQLHNTVQDLKVMLYKYIYYKLTY